MRDKVYLVLLVDREKAKMFTMAEGAVITQAALVHGNVPKNVKHGSNAGDAQDKIYRHIENHLHRHLSVVAKKANNFAQDNHIYGVIIGSHKPLFAKIKKHIRYPLSRKIRGEFVTELKEPINKTIRRAMQVITSLESQEKKLLLKPN